MILRDTPGLIFILKHNVLIWKKQSIIRPGLPWRLSGKESSCQWRFRVQSLDWEDPLEKEMATDSSILARRIPWKEELGGLHSMGLQRIRHDLSAKQQQHSKANRSGDSHQWKENLSPLAPKRKGSYATQGTREAPGGRGRGNTEGGLYCGFWGEEVSASSGLASSNHFSGLWV